MILIRRTHAPASLLVLALCALLLAFSASASAAPEGGEGEPPLPQLGFEPASYDFGLQQVYGSSQATLQLRNVGTVPAPVNALDVNGGSGVFWINGTGTNCYGRSLEPGESCLVQVVFNPYEAEPFGAQLRAYSDGGVTVTAELRGEGGRARLAPTVDPTNFGSVPVGSPGVTHTIDVTNFGNYPAGAFIAVIAGGAVGSFQLLDENCSGVPIMPGATCNLVVRFQPVSIGAKTARLGLFGDSEGGTQITLTGVGLDPEPVAQGLPRPASVRLRRRAGSAASTTSHAVPEVWPAAGSPSRSGTPSASRSPTAGRRRRCRRGPSRCSRRRTASGDWSRRSAAGT